MSGTNRRPARRPALAMLVAAVALAAAPVARADGNLGAWFKSLKQPITGMSCCDMADCHAVEARPRADGGWDARLYDEWVPMPRDRILPTLSRIGPAVACTSSPMYYEGASGPSFMIYCFVPPAMSM